MSIAREVLRHGAAFWIRGVFQGKAMPLGDYIALHGLALE